MLSYQKTQIICEDQFFLMQFNAESNFHTLKIPQASISTKQISSQPSNKNNLSTERTICRQITYKIKDGLYLATSLDAFKDEQFILLNWIEHILVFENDRFPFDCRLKCMYGQQGDEILEQGQQMISYLHFDSSLFQSFSFAQEQEQTPSQKLDESLIRQLHQSSSEPTKTVKNFTSIYNLIEASHSLGSSCLIMPSNLSEEISDLSCTFSICTAYMMTKYKWSLYKTLQFMNSRMKDVNLSQKTYEWLNKVEISLLEKGRLTYNWEMYQSVEELVLRNTFLNAKKIVCDNTLRKIEINGQVSSTERIRSRSKLENPPFKKPNLTNRTYGRSLSNGLRPILKENLETLLTLRTQRKRIEINTALNLVKEYEINSKEFQNDEPQISKLETAEKQDASNSFESSKSSNFLSISRNKRISLCVNKIVSKYREERSLQDGNSCKFIRFDDNHDMSMRGMPKKKSFQSFESFKNLENQQTKELKGNSGEEISKILRKMKMKHDGETKNQQRAILIISNTQPSASNQIELENDEKIKLKAQHANQINNKKKENRQSPQQKLSRNHSSDAKETKISTYWDLNLFNSKQIPACRSQQKLRQLKQSLEIKPYSKPKIDQKKQSLIEKMNGNTQIYIKQVKTQKYFERKHSMKENIDSVQKHKEKNLMIEYEDFKEMIKKKQKSIGNLVGNYCKEQNVLKEKSQNSLSAVIEKLKKDVSEVQASMTHGQGQMPKKNENSNKKISGSKTPTLKWR